ncbi:hypothetical protein BGX28_006719 [Mortierella sp. GBA30]|nr:hypothetical protein BGX28_006719 [Mortierella sp. GBA30]
MAGRPAASVGEAEDEDGGVEELPEENAVDRSGATAESVVEDDVDEEEDADAGGGDVGEEEEEEEHEET